MVEFYSFFLWRIIESSQNKRLISLFNAILINDNLEGRSFLITSKRESQILEREVIIVQSFDDNFYDNLPFLISYWPKTIERIMKIEDKNIMWVWKRKLFKIVAQISFIYLKGIWPTLQYNTLDASPNQVSNTFTLTINFCEGSTWDQK